MPKSPDAFRTISEVADWLGVQAHVLRFWESKFSQIKPIKRAGGRRYYRPADMLLLGGIKKLLHDDGLTIKGVQKILREQGMSHVADQSQALDDLTMAVIESNARERAEETAEGPEPEVSVAFDAPRDEDAPAETITIPLTGAEAAPETEIAEPHVEEPAAPMPAVSEPDPEPPGPETATAGEQPADAPPLAEPISPPDTVVPEAAGSDASPQPIANLEPDTPIEPEPMAAVAPDAPTDPGTAPPADVIPEPEPAAEADPAPASESQAAPGPIPEPDAISEPETTVEVIAEPSSEAMPEPDLQPADQSASAEAPEQMAVDAPPALEVADTEAPQEDATPAEAPGEPADVDVDDPDTQSELDLSPEQAAPEAPVPAQNPEPQETADSEPLAADDTVTGAEISESADTSAGEAADPDSSDTLPSFIRRPLPPQPDPVVDTSAEAAQTATEAEPEAPPTAPKPRIIELAPLPQEDQMPATPAALSALSRTPRIDTQAQASVKPLLAELIRLRASMIKSGTGAAKD